MSQLTGKDIAKSMSKRHLEVSSRKRGIVARGVLALLVVGVLAVSGGIVYTALAQTPPGGPGEEEIIEGGVEALGGPGPDVNCNTDLPQPGFPRNWEAGIPVSTYCTANAVNRNLLTALPLIGWSGLGPAISISLYHNSADVTSTLPLTDGMGFDMGPGWRMSYGTQIILGTRLLGRIAIQTATVVYDDGTRHEYQNWGGGLWNRPKGVFSILTGDATNGYQVTHKDQSYMTFDANGRLSAIGDAVGNEVTIARETSPSLNYRLTKVTDASGRYFDFNYTGSQLTSVSMPTYPDIAARLWTFTYNNQNRLETITDPDNPAANVISIADYSGAMMTENTGYDTDGHIIAITDKLKSGEEGHTTKFTYFALQGMIQQATDPDEGPALTQTFLTTCSPSIETTYTDRRGSDWLYTASYAGSNVPMVNGPMQATSDPLSNTENFTYSFNWLLTNYFNEEGHEWQYTYDVKGNLLTATDPVGAVANPVYNQTWAYDSLNNVTQYTDPLDNVTTYDYDQTYPTLLTKITEPQVAGQNAETDFTYYADEDGICVGGASQGLECTSTVGDLEGICDDDPNNLGTCDFGFKRQLLNTVTDPNGIVTFFNYDGYGQRKDYKEGEYQPGVYAFGQTFTVDAGSRTTSSSTLCDASSPLASGGGNGGGTSYKPNNRASSTQCYFSAVPCDLNAYNFWPTVSAFTGPSFPEESSYFTAITYAGFGGAESVPVKLNVDGETDVPRTHYKEFDELNRVIEKEIRTKETGLTLPSLRRQFTFSYDVANGSSRQIDPENKESHTQLDTANRVTLTERVDPDFPMQPLLKAQYTYYADGQLDEASYGLGGISPALSQYFYDSANRVTRIDHRDGNYGLVYLRLVYSYTNDDLPATITEFEEIGIQVFNQLATTTYEYDARRRLTREERTGSSPYDLNYEYDAGGNRTTKTDHLADVVVTYHYDMEDPNLYLSKNNRLMYYTTDFDDGQNVQPISTTYYVYNKAGNPIYVYTQLVDHTSVPEFFGTKFAYAKNGQSVTHVTTAEWDNPGVTTYTSVRAFRYDTGRERYLVRELDPEDTSTALSETWSDYVGDRVYGDFTLSGLTVTNTKFFEPGVGEVDDPLVNPLTEYYKTDHLGTTRAMFDWDPAFATRQVNTAFGELIGGNNPRYGYAGAWGYQTHNEMSFLHVGARYYDPATGRFLQRDPIGVQGGVNVYEYVKNRPTKSVDPDGLRTHDTMTMEIIVRDHMRAGMSHQEATAAMARSNGWALAAGCGAAGGAMVGIYAIKHAPKIRKYVRFESHQIPGYRNFGPVKHINIGKRHIIIDPRVWKQWLYKYFGD